MKRIPEPNIPALMTAPAAAHVLCVSIATLRRWRRNGYGPNPVVLGTRTIRYRLHEVFNFVSDNIQPIRDRVAVAKREAQFVKYGSFASQADITGKH